jgi:N-acetyldiaminopimelate deacetylase
MSIRALDLTEVRKELHRIPEPAFKEIKTRDLLLHYLQPLEDISIHLFMNSTGILVEYSAGEGPYLLFRADMDALPVTEQTDCGFASVHEGMMHACGHDMHMTILLGLIYKVAANRPAANLLFLFQPAEEGMGGAESVLAEKLIQAFDVKHAFALHVTGHLPLNTVSSKAGIFFAIPQEFDVEFTGKSAHAAFPEKGRNALAGGLEFYKKAHKFIANLQIMDKVIFNIGVMNSGVIRNIIPDKCLLQGTHRTLDKTVRDIINAEIATLARETAKAHNLKHKVELLCTYDPVVNDAELCRTLKTVCRRLNVDYKESKTFMTGEDFGFFTTMYPGLLFWLGAGEQPYGLHSEKFLPDEACIPTGINVFYQLVEFFN